jgi:hypothetical protein
MVRSISSYFKCSFQGKTCLDSMSKEFRQYVTNFLYMKVREILISPDEYMASVKSDNNILFIGMGLFAIGLVTTCLGLGEKGFKTSELKLVGPCLAGCGIVLAGIRVIMCTARPHYKAVHTDSTNVTHKQEKEQSGKLCG